jgi:hypothetical protein
MKSLKYIFIALFASSFILGCEEQFSPNEYGTDTVKLVDPFLQIENTVISFQAGIPDYTLTATLVNSADINVSKVNVYSIFTDAKTQGKTNETLITSLDVPPGNRVSLTKKLTYDDLKKGLLLAGNALPAKQEDLAVGSGWKLRFEGVTTKGNITLDGNVNVGVLSRFAGIYKIVEFKYFRIGVPTDLAEYNVGASRFIGSVNENTFAYNDYWGGFAWAGKSFNFTIDKNNKINVPILTKDGLIFGNRELNCSKDLADMKNVPCEGSNVLIPNDATGKHRIKLTYGYFTDGSGPREFYEVLEKQ